MAETFYFTHSTHTLASMLREALEREAAPDEFTACVVYHPLDRHVEGTARSGEAVRTALLSLREQLQTARREATRLRSE